MKGGENEYTNTDNVWCYTVVLMPYSTCCKLYGDLLSTKL